MGRHISQYRQAIEDIARIGNINEMTIEELEPLVAPLQRETQRRIAALHRANLADSPAELYWKRYGLKPSKQKLNQMKNEDPRAYVSYLKNQTHTMFKFLQDKTSTVAGAQDTISYLNRRLGTNYTNDEIREVWEIMDWFRNMDINFKQSYALELRRVSNAYREIGSVEETKQFLMEKYGYGTEDTKAGIELDEDKEPDFTNKVTGIKREGW